MMDTMEDKSLCGLIKFHSARLAEVAKDTEELQASIDNEVVKAYQKGFEDGKAVNNKGCEGCMYQDNTIEHHPCGVCRNAYNNRWKAKYDKEHEGPPGRARKLIEEEPPAQLFFRWIPCSVINQCFIPELKNVEYAGMLFTYRTPKGRLRVRETWIERGRIVGKKMNGTPIAYMSLPEPYKGVTE